MDSLADLLGAPGVALPSCVENQTCRGLCVLSGQPFMGTHRRDALNREKTLELWFPPGLALGGLPRRPSFMRHLLTGPDSGLNLRNLTSHVSGHRGELCGRELRWTG